MKTFFIKTDIDKRFLKHYENLKVVHTTCLIDMCTLPSNNLILYSYLKSSLLIESNWLWKL